MAIASNDLSEKRVRESWIQWALSAYQQFREDYEKFEQYYEGEHKLEFATDRWVQTFGKTFKEFSDNWCQVIVDSMVQRLFILGWSSDRKTVTQNPFRRSRPSLGEVQGDEGGDDLARIAEQIWDESHVDQEAYPLHLQTAVKGDGYLIVWPDPEEGSDLIEMFYNDATEVNVHYDSEHKHKIIRASKRWQEEDGTVRLNIYLPDAVHKFQISKDTPMAQVDLMGNADFDSNVLPMGFRRTEKVENPYGIVPVFHFKNKARGSTHGMSELKAVIPIQNAINKMLMDMMIASEFGAFNQKWMAGGGHPKEGWKAGPERVWATTDPSARFGQFEATDIEPYTRVIESLVTHVAKITQTPMHYLRVSGDMPSGEALKTAESSLIYKAKDRVKELTHPWSHAMTFAVALKKGASDADDIKEAMKNPVFPLWRDPETTHDLEQAQTAQLKSILGIPLTVLWAELGYSQDQIEEFKKENKAIAASVMAQLIAQVGQLPPGLVEQAGVADVPGLQAVLEAAAKGDIVALIEGLKGLDTTQVMSILPKSLTAKSTAGEATGKPQPNTSPPASPTRRSGGFRD